MTEPSERRMREMVDAVMLDVGGLTRKKAEAAVRAVLSVQRSHDNEDYCRRQVELHEKGAQRRNRKGRVAYQG